MNSEQKHQDEPQAPVVASNALFDLAQSLIAKATDNDLPIEIKNGHELFGDEADHLIMIWGAITTEARFQRFDDSCAHLMPDGKIMRYCQQIGTAYDISEKSNGPS